MIKRTILFGLTGLSLMACGGNTPATNTTNTNAVNTNVTANANAPSNVANTANTTPANVANKPATTNASDKPANTTAAKPAESGPKRVSFAAGKSEGSESVSLKAGELKQFVVGAKNGQIFMVDADSKDIEITMIKGKDAAQMKEPGHYDSTLTADGDFVFQVKNTSKKDVKSSISVVISHTGVSKP